MQALQEHLLASPSGPSFGRPKMFLTFLSNRVLTNPLSAIAPALLYHRYAASQHPCRRLRHKKSPFSGLCLWRRERDSNPRYAINVYSLSRGAPSAARPSLQIQYSLSKALGYILIYSRQTCQPRGFNRLVTGINKATGSVAPCFTPWQVSLRLYSLFVPHHVVPHHARVLVPVLVLVLVQL